MATSQQPVVYLAPTAPIVLSIDSEQQILGITLPGAGGPVLSFADGIAGPVLSVNGFTGAVLVLGPIVATLADGPVITPNLATAGHFRVTIGGNRTLANPVNALIDGQRWLLEVIQDGTGGRTLNYGSQFFFPTTVGVPVLGTAPGTHNFIGFVYNLPVATHYCVGWV